MRDSIERIRRVIADGTIKKGKLAEEAEVSPEALDNVLRDGGEPRASTVTRLTDALDRIAARLAA
jgi:DNA-binding phage protein